MEINDLKHRVGRHFFDLVDADANPLVVALALQDNSSVGLQHYSDEFHELHAELREMLRSRVEFSYQGFNESVGVYRQVVNSLKLGHEEIQTSKQSLLAIQEQIRERKPVLKELQQKSMLYKQKLDILDDLESVEQLPQKFEQAVAQKQFDKAKTLLTHSLEVVTIRDFGNQPAVKPLLVYVQQQQTQLIQKLIDEVRAHLYLTSPFSQRRLLLTTVDQEYEEFMAHLPEIKEVDGSENPESNSFIYLSSLIKTLASLQSLDSSLESIQRRIPHDLNAMIQSATRDVIRDLKLTPDSVNLNQNLTLLEQFETIDQTALSVLARSLFLRLTRFLEAQRAVSEVAKQFGVSYNLDPVCQRTTLAVQNFVLYYLGSEDQLKNEKMANSNSNQGKGSANQSIFEFGPADEDPKSLRDFETLRETLKTSVPGLLADDPNHLFAETQQEEQLEAVAPAHILNIRPLLEPLTMFFASASQIANSDKSRQLFDGFLDRFLQQQFVPRLRTAFDLAIDDIANSPDAFEEMPNWRSRSQLPIVRCASQFYETVGLLSQLLDTGATYREDYSAMLVGLLSRISKYFEQHLQSLFRLSANPTRFTTAGGRRQHAMIKVWELASTNPLAELLELRYEGKSRPADEFNFHYGKRQGHGQNKSQIALSDLIEVTAFKKISLLITSIHWALLRMRRMRKVSSGEVNSSSHNISSRVRRRWTLLDTSRTSHRPNDSVSNATAILSGENLNLFDDITNRLQSISFRALASLRASIFLGIVYHFDQMIANRDFSSSNRGEERDPVVDRIQHELSVSSQVFDQHLLESDRKFVLSGLPEFMNQLFILESSNISEMNEAGQNQILTNIFALQQMLTSIVSDPRNVDFSRATGFYELFRLNPSLVIDKAREGDTDLGYEDLKYLLQIRHRNPTAHFGSTLDVQLNQLAEIFNSQRTPRQSVQPAPQQKSPERSPRKVISRERPALNPEQEEARAAEDMERAKQLKAERDALKRQSPVKQLDQMAAELSNAEQKQKEVEAREREERKEFEAKEAQREAQQKEAQRVAEQKEAQREAQRVAEQREAQRVAEHREAQRAAEQREAEQREAQREAQRVAEQREAQRVAEQREAEQRIAEQRAAEQRAEQRIAEQRAAEQRAEQRAIEQRVQKEEAEREEQRRAYEQQRIRDQQAEEQRIAELEASKLKHASEIQELQRQEQEREHQRELERSKRAEEQRIRDFEKQRAEIERSNSKEDMRAREKEREKREREALRQQIIKERQGGASSAAQNAAYLAAARHAKPGGAAQPSANRPHQSGSRGNLRNPLTLNIGAAQGINNLDAPISPELNRPRTPSERALEASQRVRNRHVPPPRRTS